MISAGYSQTPLAKKLGIKAGFRLRLVHPPEHYAELFSDFPENISFVDDPREKKEFIHYFTKSIKDLESDIPGLKAEMLPNAMIWVSWPKKASKVATDVTEDLIRNIALANGLVDIKVCAIDQVWSGLKLVIPVRYRNA